MRKHLPVAALLVLVAAIALSASLVTSASALPTFTNAVGGIGPCASCHTMDATHANPNHTSLGCSSCHLSGTATPPTPAACGVCHGGTSVILTTAAHVAQGCSTTPGCHGAPAPEPVTTTVSLSVKPTTIKLKASVKGSGKVTPVTELVGAKVVLKAEIKSGSKWKSAKSGSATVSATGTYSWTYKPAKKGTYRMTASIAKTADHKASKSKTITFKVK